MTALRLDVDDTAMAAALAELTLERQLRHDRFDSWATEAEELPALGEVVASRHAPRNVQRIVNREEGVLKLTLVAGRLHPDRARFPEQVHRARFVGEQGGIRADGTRTDQEAGGSQRLEQSFAKRPRLSLVGSVEKIEADRRVRLIEGAPDASARSFHSALRCGASGEQASEAAPNDHNAMGIRSHRRSREPP